MRLIDADEYKKQLSVGWMFYTGEDEGKADCFASAMDDLADMPTIDAEPVVHAHWIGRGRIHKEGDRIYACSHCGFPTWMFPDDLGDAKYCQFCGARMDEEVGA